jgi:hypothetical protein
MTEKKCPYFEEMVYSDQSKSDPKNPLILKYAFTRLQKLHVSSDAGGMLGGKPMPPTLSEIYDGDNNGETMDYPAEGKCTVTEKIVLVTRHCLETLCSNNHGKCPRFLKTMETPKDSKKNQDIHWSMTMNHLVMGLEEGSFATGNRFRLITRGYNDNTIRGRIELFGLKAKVNFLYKEPIYGHDVFEVEIL